MIQSSEGRARLSLGMSSDFLHQRAAQVVFECLRGLCVADAMFSILDVGCGKGGLRAAIEEKCKGHLKRYVGIDSIRYDEPMQGIEFIQVDLNSEKMPFQNGIFDVVISVETIEHLENPRALVREMRRLCKPGGWVILTTPNQLSLLSKMTLLLKNEFN